MTNPNVIPLTAQQFAQLVQEFEQQRSGDPALDNLVQTLCGSLERARRFTQRPSGLGISGFAALVDLPASTVRHYQRLGLITPYEVGGKFRFWFHNVLQVESIRQWRDLGLSLEEIQAQRHQDRLGGQAATFNVSRAGFGVIANHKAAPLNRTANLGRMGANIFDPYTVWLPLGAERMQVTSRQVFQGKPDDPWRADIERLRSEVSAARLRLEKRLHALEAQLTRARLLEAALTSTHQARPGQTPPPADLSPKP